MPTGIPCVWQNVSALYHEFKQARRSYKKSRHSVGPVPSGNPVGRLLTLFQHRMTVTEADKDKSVCLQFFSLAAMDQLGYSNVSAQPQRSCSSAALDQLSHHNQSAQLQYISSPAAICAQVQHYLLWSPELQCVSSSANTQSTHLLARLRWVKLSACF